MTSLATELRSRFPVLRHAGLAGRYLLLAGVLVLMVQPLLWQLTTSLKARGEDLFGTGATLLPQHWSLHAYSEVMDQIPVAGYVRNSLILVVLSLVSHLVFATAGGYMLSRPGWRGRKAVFLLLVIAMMFPFESIMVSLFLEIRDFGLMDSLTGVWLPGIVGSMNVLVMRAAFLAVPQEIEDAALLDGANEWQRFYRIFLPAGIGGIMVVGINTVIAAWDDFLWPLIVLQNEENFPLTLGLARLQNSAFVTDERVVMAGSMISVIPIMILFFLTQRYFYKGIEAGAVKL
ncbi:carbohydrate ABC transporter permease [Streptomyces sp. bgisy031]|uniref:carbohydrate ABC transporter permease n=1 Tax=Streptomyces sp. bgisy031 TaxID=3413772 RepID=UPI003D7646C7